MSARPSRLARVLAPLLAGVLASCAHQALVETDPPGAEVYVNGQRVGHAPVAFEDPGGWSRSYEVVLRKDGYQRRQVTLTQDQVNPAMLAAAGVGGACTGGLAALYFLPRSRSLQDRYRFVLQRNEPLPPLAEPPGAGGDAPGNCGTPPCPFRY